MLDTTNAFPAAQQGPVLPHDISDLLSGWDPSRPAADLIAAINERFQSLSPADEVAANYTGSKKRGKCMSRRPGQDGSKEFIEGGWYKFRLWIDIPGQDKRAHPSFRICPVKGPGSMTASERQARMREIAAEHGIKNKEIVKTETAVTFGEQGKLYLEHLKTRQRKPTAEGSVRNVEQSLRLHLNPVLGEMPLSEIYNPQLKLVVQALVKKGMAATTINGHITFAKQVMSSAVDVRTGEELYPRTWNAEQIDLPEILEDEKYTPCFTGETITGVIAYHSDDPQMRTLFTLLAAGGLRISECLGLEIDKHISPDFRTITIEQQADGRKISYRVKRPASKRQVDLHPDIATVIKAFVGDRTSGFLFQTSKGNPPSHVTVGRKLHLALAALNYVNECTGTHFAGEHAFRRFRDTYLRNKARCPDGVIKFWLGHSFGKNMTELYDKVKRDVELRRELAESCGYGFDLPSCPVVPERILQPERRKAASRSNK